MVVTPKARKTRAGLRDLYRTRVDGSGTEVEELKRLVPVD
jgi:hypothetical protein